MKNNFPDRRLFNTKYIADLVYPPDVTVIYRSALLKYVLTCNPKTKKDKEIEKNIDIINYKKRKRKKKKRKKKKKKRRKKKKKII